MKQEETYPTPKKRNFASRMVAKLLMPFYVIVDSSVPIKEKVKIIAAFGYFFLPVDVIPDILPLIGFTDDLTVLVLLWRVMRKNILSNDRVRQRAMDRADRLFPPSK